MSVPINAFHLPPNVAGSERITIVEHAGARVVAPRLDAARIHLVCAKLETAREKLLRFPVERTIAAIDSAARALRDPANATRHDVLQSLESITGYSAPMAEHVLDRMSEDWLAPALRQLHWEELGGIAYESPALGLHVFSGNVPGVNVTSIVRSLLVRTAVFGKTALQEPVLAPAFARLIADADTEVGDCLAVTYWTGGDDAIETAALEHAGIVVHYGGADAIASLRSRTARHARHVPFVEHGPRISFAIVNGSQPHDHAAHDLAGAVAMFDQQGCVSPQIAYFVGAAVDAVAFAADVADELHRIEHRLPRGRVDAAEAAAIREMRARFEFRADAHLWTGDPLRFTVAYSDDTAFEGSCLNRTLIIKRADTFDDVVSSARPFCDYLQTVGLTGFADGQAAALAAIGVTRVAQIRDMPWPSVTWHHDGRRPLRELLIREAPIT